MADVMTALTTEGRHFWKYASSRRVIPAFKGFLSYMLAMILLLIRPFDELIETFPIAYTSLFIVILSGYSGKSMGATIQTLGFALLGVGTGAVVFVILAELGHQPVPQAIIFAFWVYCMALLKARSPRWLPCTLLSVVLSFNGIYTSALLKTTLSTGYLKDYLVAYCWGAVIVLGVNLAVFPITSEKELRQTIVASLDHVATLSHLLAKGYTLEINEEEKSARDQLVQNITADYGFMVQKLEATSVEINYSYYSIKDYRVLISQLRICQLSLLSAHSSIAGVQTPDLGLFRERFLPGVTETFCKLRRALDITIRDIGEQLNCKPMHISATQAGFQQHVNRGDLEQQSRDFDMSQHLEQVSEQLASEVKDADTRSRMGGEKTDTISHTTSKTDEPGPTKLTATSSLRNLMDSKRPCGMNQLRLLYNEFSDKQLEKFTDVIMSGSLHGDDNSLRVEEPLPSLRAMYGLDLVDASHDDEYSPYQLRKRNVGQQVPTAVERKLDEAYDAGNDLTRRTHQQTQSDKLCMASHSSLLRVYTFIFAMGQFVDALEKLYETSEKKTRKIHMHIFESFGRPHIDPGTECEQEMPLCEALALLENRPYVPKKTNFLKKLSSAEHLLRTPQSVYAAKVAAAATVFALLILTKGPREWFLTYNLTGGMVTIFVALAPTLGQSITTFIFQVLGSSIGYLYGLVLLEIFKHVDGFSFNPYGIACLLAPYALVMHMVLYEKPKYFVVTFLGLNSCAVLITTEYIYTEVEKKKYDSPPLKTGKYVTALVLALTIVAVFQLFVLRNPARRTLRKTMAHALASTLSLATLFQAYARAVAPADAKVKVNHAVKRRVNKELEHREHHIQSEVIALHPLFAFASAEPEYFNPFKQDTIGKIIKSTQIILDRFREARNALGEEPLDEKLINDFVRPLSTYRRINYRVIKNSLSQVSTSLAVKAPMPHETMAQWNRVKDFQHDALVLSTRFSRDPKCSKYIRTGRFMRYWAYLMVVANLAEQLLVLEDLTKDLVGEIETNLL